MTMPDDRSLGAPGEVPRGGFLRFMAEHAVAANILMILLLGGGFLMSRHIRQEVYPEFRLDEVRISVSYPGASPEDVEQGMILAIEEAVRGVSGVHDVTSQVREGGGRVTVELLGGVAQEIVLSDLQTAVDQISSFPQHVERPNIAVATNRAQVVTLVVYGDEDEATIRALAARTRDGLLADPDITNVSLAGMRAPEISIDVEGATLRSLGLTLDEIAARVRSAVVEMPGGGIKSPRGEVLVRTSERKEVAREFEDIVVMAGPQGDNVQLGDIAHVRDGFSEVNRLTYFNGKQAARLIVYRVGEQTPLTVSQAVNRYIEEHQERLPPGVSFAVWEDASEDYEERVKLLLSNAYTGLVLVLLIMGLFLNIKLAFWVTLGIPIAILGSLMLMPLAGVSFNMISLFAFILTLGIVVDDAIVVGEAIYKQREEGLGPLEASVAGVREVAVPIVFSILTTATVFLPLMAIPGMTGKLYGVIPVVVILVLIMSLIEALFILPAHLAHSRPGQWRGALARVMAVQEGFGELLERFIEERYRPWLGRALELRYLCLAVGVGLLMVVGALVMSGRIPFTFFPPVEGNVVMANVRMPFGSDARVTREAADVILQAANELLAEEGGAEGLSRGILTELGRGAPGSGPLGNLPGARSHIARVSVFFVSADDREVTSAEFARRWRERVGEMPGVETLTFGFGSAQGPDAGSPVEVQLSHGDSRVLDRAAQELAARLSEMSGVVDVDSGVSQGKEQLDVRLRPEARSLGLTESALGRQLRAAFFGVEAVRMQRGRDELRVYVRRPPGERSTEESLEQMVLMTPGGGEVPLSDAAILERARGHVVLHRDDGRRIVSVTASVNEDVTTGNQVMTALRAGILDELVDGYPGLSWKPGGEQEEQDEAMGRLRQAMLLAFMAMYMLLALVFRSYVQPLIVMCAIPFGFIGAIAGHLLMGYSLSFMSVMGIIALSGIVVNASLILVDTINARVRRGVVPHQAILDGASRRFRPILLTATTTFIGLAPMILETSVQARFLIPMAISVGFGVLFGALVCLVLVPCLLAIVHDVQRAALARRP